MLGEVVRFEFPALPGMIGVARSVAVATAGTVPDLDDERLDDLRIAVSEACTNAMEAHRDPTSEAPIVLRCFVHDDAFEVRIQDRGEGFDPNAVPARPGPEGIEDVAHERGWGIQLIRSLMDEVEFVSDDGGTAVRLVLRRNP